MLKREGKPSKLSTIIPKSGMSKPLADPRRTPTEPFCRAVEKPSRVDGQGRKR